MEEIFEKIEELFKSKNIEFKTIEINDEKIEKIIKEIIDNENEIIKTPKKIMMIF